MSAHSILGQDWTAITDTFTWRPTCTFVQGSGWGIPCGESPARESWPGESAAQPHGEIPVMMSSPIETGMRPHPTHCIQITLMSLASNSGRYARIVMMYIYSISCLSCLLYFLKVSFIFYPIPFPLWYILNFLNNLSVSPVRSFPSCLACHVLSFIVCPLYVYTSVCVCVIICPNIW